MTEIDDKIEMVGRQRFVDSVFERVASRYDIMNDVMSGGIHRLWKDAAINWLAPSPMHPSTVLDVAGGTGDISKRFLQAAAQGSHAVICDINYDMIVTGRDRLMTDISSDHIHYVQGNAEHLPIATSSLQYYTISFGIRNVPAIDLALREAFRVLKPGGRFLCLEFSQVTVPFLDTIYEKYSEHAVPMFGQWITGNAEPYRYLIESIRKFPNQTNFARMITKAGFTGVKYRNLSAGIAAMHTGIKA